MIWYLAHGTHADVVVLDPSLCNADSVELITMLKQSYPATLILVFSFIDREEHVVQMMRNGASAYVLKSISPDEMMYAIIHIKAGGKYLCAEMSMKLLECAAARVMDPQAHAGKVVLSKRELEVLVLIADGLTNNEIAGKLFTSRRTVEGHRKKLLDKTGVRNTAALIRYAVKHGLVQ